MRLHLESWTGLALRQAQGEAYFLNLMVSLSNHEVGTMIPPTRGTL